MNSNRVQPKQRSQTCRADPPATQHSSTIGRRKNRPHRPLPQTDENKKPERKGTMPFFDGMNS
jgi:hypothetical protein